MYAESIVTLARAHGSCQAFVGMGRMAIPFNLSVAAPGKKRKKAKKEDENWRALVTKYDEDSIISNFVECEKDTLSHARRPARARWGGVKREK